MSAGDRAEAAGRSGGCWWSTPATARARPPPPWACASGRWGGGCGWRWCSSSRASGRPASACSPRRLPELTFLVMGRGFTWDSDDLSRDKEAAAGRLAQAAALIAAGEHAVVILDELTYVLNYGFVPMAEVLEALEQRPAARARRDHRPQRPRGAAGPRRPGDRDAERQAPLRPGPDRPARASTI